MNHIFSCLSPWVSCISIKWNIGLLLISKLNSLLKWAFPNELEKHMDGLKVQNIKILKCGL
jgi:hypothetical protein